ncbi:hypothetical protein SDC9_03549 [bioreactor metagenome]|uniref:Transcription regulator YsiA C-terminal domain-containing protein n=1 Tax=bioreactor metagenome TaxID=1076179 RepID=A0A644STT4_9ZZZZ|nr:TetR/AcrR family transcriptional regulator C-terminal domain-containing protein [Methanobrevibacter sp.]MEA4956168.1 TetR/AcrR family transcriptional regulator C-terminal domain-containing protein [Methanobrevibacter sp.]
MFIGIYHQNPEYRHLFIDTAENILNLLKELIDEAKNKKEINCNIDSKEISFFIFSNMRGIVDIWINSNYKADQLIDSNLKIIKKVIK